MVVWKGSYNKINFYLTEITVNAFEIMDMKDRLQIISMLEKSLVPSLSLKEDHKRFAF